MFNAKGKHCSFLVALWLPCAASAAPDRAQATRSAYHELQLATVSTHQALRALSPVLSDLIAAYHVALAQAQLPAARSGTPIHPRLRHRLRTLASRVQGATEVSGLPPLPRVYHGRASAALMALGNAETLSELLAPSHALIAALQHLQVAERDLVSANAQAQAPDPPQIDPVWAGPIDEAMQQLKRLEALLAESPRPQALDAQVELFWDGRTSVRSTVTWPKIQGDQVSGLTLALCAVDGTRKDDQPARCYQDIDPLSTRFEETLPGGIEAWRHPPSYRISTVSPFGVHSRPHDHGVKLTGACVQGPTNVSATSLAPAADSPDFYRLMDAVAVSWHRSLSDAPLDDWDESLQVRPPHRLVGYRIFRVTQQQVEKAQRAAQAIGPQKEVARDEALYQALMPYHVGDTPPGTDSFIDRPPLGALAAGLQYIVAARTIDERHALGADGLSQGYVQVDLLPSLALAAHGAQWAHQPLLWERQRIKNFSDDASLLRGAQKQFLQHTSVAQRALWEGFWRSTPVEERQAWWRQGPSLYGEQASTLLRAQAASGLTMVGQKAAQLALYIEAHADVAAAIDQHWALLDEADKRRAHHNLHEPSVRAAYEVVAPAQDGVGGPIDGVETIRSRQWPERVAAWWLSRDEAQVAAVAIWWHSLPDDVRLHKLTTWLAGIGDATLDDLMWPPWPALHDEEQQAWLDRAPATIPATLWPRFLAHIDHQVLPLHDRVQAVRADVGALQSFLTQSRYLCRPLDKMLKFNLRVALTFVGLGLLSGYLLGFARVPHDNHELE